jgi:hypothetical protein
MHWEFELEATHGQGGTHHGRHHSLLQRSARLWVSGGRSFWELLRLQPGERPSRGEWATVEMPPGFPLPGMAVMPSGEGMS